MPKRLWRSVLVSPIEYCLSPSERERNKSCDLIFSKFQLLEIGLPSHLESKKFTVYFLIYFRKQKVNILTTYISRIKFALYRFL